VLAAALKCRPLTLYLAATARAAALHASVAAAVARHDGAAGVAAGRVAEIDHACQCICSVAAMDAAVGSAIRIC
jgi:hypothetical protein